MSSQQESQTDERDVVRRQLEELLSELRVALPGVQVLLRSFLTLPFTSRFSETTATNQTTYFVAFVSAAISSVLLIAPSAMHRIQHGDGGDRGELVQTATILAIAGSAALVVTMKPSYSWSPTSSTTTYEPPS